MIFSINKVSTDIVVFPVKLYAAENDQRILAFNTAPLGASGIILLLKSIWPVNPPFTSSTVCSIQKARISSSS
jgi:hypothetical protein